MNPAQVAAVLGKAQIFDNREVSQPVILAWHEILAPYDYQLALDAVAAHYADGHRWIMPSHIVTYVKAHDPGAWDKAKIDEILGGPDYWSQPSPPDGQSFEEYRVWSRRVHAEHLEERRAKAVQVVARSSTKNLEVVLDGR